MCKEEIKLSKKEYEDLLSVVDKRILIYGRVRVISNIKTVVRAECFSLFGVRLSRFKPVRYLKSFDFIRCDKNNRTLSRFEGDLDRLEDIMQLVNLSEFRKNYLETMEIVNEMNKQVKAFDGSAFKSQ